MNGIYINYNISYLMDVGESGLKWYTRVKRLISDFENPAQL